MRYAYSRPPRRRQRCCLTVTKQTSLSPPGPLLRRTTELGERAPDSRRRLLPQVKQRRRRPRQRYRFAFGRSHAIGVTALGVIRRRDYGESRGGIHANAQAGFVGFTLADRCASGYAELGFGRTERRCLVSILRHSSGSRELVGCSCAQGCGRFLTEHAAVRARNGSEPGR
jgi:hypothetical protein